MCHVVIKKNSTSLSIRYSVLQRIPLFIPLHFGFSQILTTKSSVINLASDKCFGLVDVGQRRLEVEYSSTEREAWTEILPISNRTSFPGHDVEGC